MHISKWEKFGASILVVAWLVFGVNSIGNFLVHVKATSAPEGGHGAAAAAKPAKDAAPAEPEKSIAELLPTVTAADGAKIFTRCKACHSADNGGGNKVGPNLYGVVGSNMAHRTDFAYSSALSGKGDKWTYENLNHFLTSPKDFVPGTKMTFAGLKHAKERAEVIAYLRGQSDSPVPLP